MSTALEAAPAPRTPRAAGRRPSPLWLVLLATALPMFMATLDNLVMTNALPVLHAEFGASVEELQWFMNAYTLAFASTILMAVALGDRFGRRTLFLIGIVVFTLSSAFAALATDPGQLITARALQGFGAAAILPLSLTLLAGSVPLARRPLAIGIWGGVAGLGVATGPLIGGAVIEGWAWQAIFWINVPVGVDLGRAGPPRAAEQLRRPAACRRRRPRALGSRAPRPRLRHRARQRGRLGQPRGARQPHRRRHPAGSRSCSGRRGRRHRCCRCGCSATAASRWRTSSGFGFSFGAFGSIFILIQFLQVVQGATPLEAALQTSPWTLAPMVVAPLAGFIAPRVGTRALIVTGLLALGGALFWLTGLLDASVEYPAYVAPFIVAGIGMGLVFAPSATAVLATMAPDDHAKASGTNSMLREVGRRARHRRVDRRLHGGRRRS